MLNSLSFFLSLKLLISPLSLKRALMGRIFCFMFSPFITLNISCHTLLPTEFLLKNCLITLWGVACMLFIALSLLLLIFSLSLISVNLITVCFSMFLFRFALYGTLCASWIWVTASFPMLGNFSAIISSSIFSGCFFSFYFSGTPIL